MAELTISADEIRAALDDYVASYSPEVSREEVGTVAETGDGIARVEGLPSAMTNELLRFEDGTLGLAQTLDIREIGVVILGEQQGIDEGQTVHRTGEILSVPVGDGFLGRVIDPARTADRRASGRSREEGRRPLELQAPSVVQRQPVKEPLQTGIKAIDAMTAIGRGQRQLIIGDRQTGKTTIAIDTILNQKANWATGDPKQQVRCIYVAIGQKGSTIAALRATLEEQGAIDYTDRRRPRLGRLRLQVPGSLHRLGHRPALDVRRQARADRLRRPVQAGRGVPGDLAAAAPAAGPRGVPGRRVLPALPAAGAVRQALRRPRGRLDDRLPDHRDQGNDISAYIPTNVISITDGQIFLETGLFNAGVRPAINVGVSVSRVGGNAQIRAMRTVAGSLRLNLAQYRELEAFSAFGSDLDKASQDQLARGSRLVELLKQPQYSPFPVEREVVSIWAGTTGELDVVPVADIRKFEREFLDYVGHRTPASTTRSCRPASSRTTRSRR